MKNITKGFRNYKNFQMEASTVIDGVRFWKGDNGEYGIMDADSRQYFETNRETEFMSRVGILKEGMFIYEVEDTDLEARELTDGEKVDLKANFSFMTPSMWEQVGWLMQFQRL